MQELKERILKEGKVLPGDIIKVDGFLNHRVDCELMSHIADEFAKFFDINDVDLLLTAEASGIALTAICALRFGKPMVYAKKAKSDNIEGGLFKSEIFSYTYKKKVTPPWKPFSIAQPMPTSSAPACLTMSHRPRNASPRARKSSTISTR